jgi:hypothetical protein
MPEEDVDALLELERAPPAALPLEVLVPPPLPLEMVRVVAVHASAISTTGSASNWTELPRIMAREDCTALSAPEDGASHRHCPTLVDLARGSPRSSP